MLQLFSKYKEAFRAFLAVAIGAALLWMVFARVDFGQMSAALRTLRWPWVLVAFAAQLCATALRGLYLGILARSPRRCVLLAASSAASNLVAMAVPGPSRDVALAALVKRAADISATYSIKVAGAVRIVEMTVRSALACILAMTIPTIAWVRYSLGLSALLLTLIGLGAILWPHYLVAAWRAALWPLRRLLRSQNRLAGIEAFLDRLLSLRDPTFLKRTAPAVAGLCLARWAFFALSSFALYQAVRASVSFSQAAYILFLSGYATSLPLRPPADFGTLDLARTGLLVSIGFSQTDAAGVVVATRLLALCIGALLGAAGLVLVLAVGSHSSPQDQSGQE